jgi:hypothetical protein
MLSSITLDNHIRICGFLLRSKPLYVIKNLKKY